MDGTPATTLHAMPAPSHVSAPGDVSTVPQTAESLHELLAESLQVIAAFRRRLRDAGYPFREPPNCDSITRRINARMHPELFSARELERVARS